MIDQPHSGPQGPWGGSDESAPSADFGGGHDFATHDAARDDALGDSNPFQSNDSPSEPFGESFDADGDAPLGAASADAAPEGAADADPVRRRSRRSRSRRRSAEPVAALDAVEAPLPFDDEVDLDLDAGEPRGEAPLENDAAAPRDGETRPRRRRGGRGRRRRSEEERPEAPTAARAPLAERVDTHTHDAEGDDVAFDDEQDEDGGERSESPAAERVDGADGSDADRKRRRRGSRGGRRRKKGREGEEVPRTDGDAPARTRSRSSTRSRPSAASGGSAAAADRDAKGRKSRRGGRRRQGSSALWVDAIPGEEDDLANVDPRRQSAAPIAVDDASAAPSDEERPTSSRRRKKAREDEDDAALERSVREQAAVERDQLILVNAVDPEETRVVVEESGRIVDLVMTVEQHTSYVNDIYRGRVVNIEDAIGAAFVDFGQGRNGFLHASDVMPIYGDEEWRLEKLLTARTDTDDWEGDTRAPTDSLEDGDGKRKGGDRDRGGRARPRGRKRKNISELLKRGQLVVAQITKDAIGDKGPTLTTFISIPGRYLVLMPSLEKTGVSRKIEDDRERRRLKRILTSLEIPPGMGVIVRTAGVGKTKEEIRRDLDYLLKVWESFSKNLVLGRNPAPLYQESAIAIRTMRDLFSSRTKAVIVDDEKVYHEMREFTEKLMPEHLDRIRLHDGAKPLFHTHGIEPDFEKLFSRRVELPSGGSIVFDQTEALVAIDVNSGRTRDEGADFEDIALKANLEAVPEIARQIKLRDLGGIIVVDFIDMMRPASRRKVEKAFCAKLDEDRARNKVGRISQFGLLELTRQRLGPGLSKLLYDACSYCRGTGRRRTAQSKAQAVLRRLGSALTQKGFTKIEISVHPDTLDWLKKNDWKEVMELEQKSARELEFSTSEDQHEDSVFHYLRADGREVRPGGRRRR